MADGPIPGWNPGAGTDPLKPEPAGPDAPAPAPDAPAPAPDAPTPGSWVPDAPPPPAIPPARSPPPQAPVTWAGPDQPSQPPSGWGAASSPSTAGAPTPSGWVPPSAGDRGRGSGPTLLVVGCLVAALMFGVVPIGLLFVGSQISTVLSDIGASVPAGSGTSVNVSYLHVGECFDEPGGSNAIVNDLLIFPCDSPHTYELIAVVELPEPHGATYPGAAQIQATAREQCGSAFTAYVGLPYEASSYDLGFYTVTEEGWNAGDRSIDCLAGKDDGSRFSSSVKGANR